jgi:penicillin-binding protein 2
VPWTRVAAKTGTVQVDGAGKYAHSWLVGFFPYEEPRYAFAIVLEQGPSGTLTGAPFVMRGVLDWMHENTPEYLKSIVE